MTEFVEFNAENPGEEWDSKLLKFNDVNFQQTYSFGEFVKTRASRVFRALLVEDDQTLVMAQGFVRNSLFGFSVLVIRGGPAFQASRNENTNLKHLRTFLQQLIKVNRERYKFLYISITMNSERAMLAEIALREAGMARPFFERDPYLTYMVPIHRDLEQNMKAFDVKWRNQLRRAEGLSPKFTWGNDDSLLKSYVSLHNSMCQIKLIESYSMSYEGIAAMRRNLGERLQFMIGTHEGRDVCGCAVVITHGQAYYYFAAANEQGRKGYFSNAMVWALIQKLQEINVTELDLSGIDPVRNWGGYHFKKGIGGKPFAYVGEWDFSSPAFLKPLMNFALFWRSKRMYR